jgi:uncharacterized membrane protein (TIGR02234 family)
MAEARTRRSFGSTVLGGLAGAVLAAVGASRVWVHARGDAAGVPVEVVAKGSDVAPLAGALALVALAAWGVVLVTRGGVRRVVAVLGALAAVGTALALVLGFADRASAALRLLRDKGASHLVSSSTTGWYWAALLGALVTLAAFAVAVRRAREWPTMGNRYDAPGSRPAPAAAETPQDMWRALDEGRDPTTRPDGGRRPLE